MSSYYPSFSYLGINSRERNLVVAHFDSDQGTSDTFLGMESIYTESADGTTRLDYGAKYNNVATIRISLIKQDGEDFSVADVRNHLKWLTGSRKNSALDLSEHFLEEFVGDGTTSSFRPINTCDHVCFVSVNGVMLSSSEWRFDSKSQLVILNSAPNYNANIKISYDRIKYSFIGRVTNAWQQKMDARTVGLILEFTSKSPWAYSPVYTVTETISGDATIGIDCPSDDLYSYVYANVTYKNSNNGSLVITNNTTGDVTSVSGLAVNEVITMTNNMMITSDKPAKTFGNSFNFVFPRFKSGINNLHIAGYGQITFEYIVPLKVGDCTMDISVISDPICNEDGEIILDTLPWSRITGAPTSLSGYGITNVYTKAEVNKKIAEISSDTSWSGITNKPSTIAGYGISDAYTKSEVVGKINELSNTIYTKSEVNAKLDNLADGMYTKSEVDEKIKNILLSEDDDVEIDTISWHQVTNTPSSLSSYGIKDAYTKAQVDAKFENLCTDAEADKKIEDAFLEIYTKTEVDDKIASAQINIDNVELQNMLIEVLY